jgi:hypothetical protein
LRICLEQRITGGYRFPSPQIAHPIQGLTVQVRFLDPIVIEDGETPDTGGARVLQHNGSQSPGAHNQHGCPVEPRLSGGTDFRDGNLPYVTVTHGEFRARPPAIRAHALRDSDGR